jgi:hypothetical protein
MVEESLRRGITKEFQKQFTSVSGVLHPVLLRVQHDDTLSLEIRNNSVAIYYRGGRLLSIEGRAGATKFFADFDTNYCGFNVPNCHELREKPDPVIVSADDARAWVRALPDLKQAMDLWFFKHHWIERECQQAVARDNNRHQSGRVSDYAIVDIEYTQSAHAIPGRKTDYKFDMVGFRWPARGRSRRSGVVTPVIMEMKVGDGALDASPKKESPESLTPGLVKHARDIERFLTPESEETVSKPYTLLREELEAMFHAKQHMKLPSVPKGMGDLKITVSDGQPEVIFILANHNPKSTILKRELLKVQEELGEVRRADYRVATVSFGGYALFASNVKPLDEFIGSLP